MPIGVIVSLESVLSRGVEGITDLGLAVCQLNSWNPEMYTPENAARVDEILRGKVMISSLWAGWPPPAVWNFIDGPLTLGLVPAAYRAPRIEALKRGADFAKWLGLTDVTTHVGFIPENPATTEYREVVIAIREVASYCRQLGLYFNFETGQETPITLMRTIEDVGLDNLGINLDPANLLLYGKANPMDAVDIYRGLVRGVHVKDGCYPTNGRELGRETPVGEGLVDFPVLLDKLASYGFRGPLIIEREISGPQQKEDILKAKAFLEQIIRNG
ncbi:MAG: sugar phosphate isomerase/epimerase [Chloroflexi bacterium]|nr:sugar phosphate isomerase/epimerase [Chloroflexota bacterium]